MKKLYSFTLIELLVVVGIIVILAGLLLPAVMGGAEQGRITQAKSDMKSILMALNQMETTYQKMWNPSGVASDVIYTQKNGNTTAVRYGGKAPSGSSYDDYENFILALSAPAQAGTNINVNVRKIRFLDPRPGFDPGGTATNNHKQMWLDPWGNEYVVIIDTSFTGEIQNPKDNTKKLSAKAIAYSFGPNGTDDSGKNVATGGGKLEDDVTSWE